MKRFLLWVLVCLACFAVPAFAQGAFKVLVVAIPNRYHHDYAVVAKPQFERMAQVHGFDLSLSQQLIAAFGCIVAGVGISGIPDAGLISLALVLTTVGLPVEIVPLLFTVDWLVGRARAITNVISDMLVAVLLDRTGSATRT